MGLIHFEPIRIMSCLKELSASAFTTGSCIWKETKIILWPKLKCHSFSYKLVWLSSVELEKCFGYVHTNEKSITKNCWFTPLLQIWNCRIYHPLQTREHLKEIKLKPALPKQSSHSIQLLRNQISRHSPTPFRIRYLTQPAGKCWHLIALKRSYAVLWRKTVHWGSLS